MTSWTWPGRPAVRSAANPLGIVSAILAFPASTRPSIAGWESTLETTRKYFEEVKASTRVRLASVRSRSHSAISTSRMSVVAA